MDGDGDLREDCKYGAKCYQKNPTHKEKYRHPPSTEGKPLLYPINTVHLI